MSLRTASSASVFEWRSEIRAILRAIGASVYEREPLFSNLATDFSTAVFRRRLGAGRHSTQAQDELHLADFQARLHADVRGVLARVAELEDARVERVGRTGGRGGGGGRRGAGARLLEGEPRALGLRDRL